MEVRLFQLGGHEYVFRFGVFRKSSDQKETAGSSEYLHQEDPNPPTFHNQVSRKKGGNGAKKVNVTTPSNKYAYTRRNISSNLGLDRFKKITAKMPEILELISQTPEKSKEVAERIQRAGLLNFELTSSKLNMFARICDGINFEDIKGKMWTLISEGWGQDSTIRKQEAL